MAHLCRDCKALSLSILSQNFGDENQWEVLSSEHDTIRRFRKQLCNSMASLEKSALEGCPLCGLIQRTLYNLGPSQLENSQQYHVFISKVSSKPYQFCVTTHDLVHFTRHVSQRPSTMNSTLEFYTRPVPQKWSTAAVDEQPSTKSPRIRRLPELDPTSKSNLELIQSRLRQCERTHELCSHPKGSLPKRVLDIRIDEPICLYITERECKPYVSLSYTWGDADRLITWRQEWKTPAGNQETNQLEVRKMRKRKNDTGVTIKEKIFTCTTNDIPLQAFSNTQQDAITIARALGFQYIWIDALCIVQNDDNDWAHQSKEMTDIYSGSTLNLSSSHTTDADQRMLSIATDDSVLIGISSDYQLSGECSELYAGEALKMYDLSTIPITSRGWVFQENLVSPNTVHFTSHGIIWECAQGTLIGFDQNPTGHRWKPKWRDLHRKECSHSTRVSVKRRDKFYYDVWYDVVCAYSSRKLFDLDDKFPAMAGVSNNFAQMYDLSNNSYLAGLWEDDFLTGLLWRRENRTARLVRDPEKWVAPTWSWASVTGLLEHRKADLIDSPDRHRLKFTCQTHEKTPGTFGKILEASLVVMGDLQRIKVDLLSRPSTRKRDTQACGISEGFVNAVNVFCTLDDPTSIKQNLYECWCLRIGSYVIDGYSSDAFLILEQKIEDSKEFRRIGYAEASGSDSPGVENSGQLVSPERREIVLI